MDHNLEGWLLITLHEKGEDHGAINIHGYVPDYAHQAYAEVLQMVDDSLGE